MSDGRPQGMINPQLQAMISGLQAGKQPIQGPASAANPGALQQPNDPAGPALKECLDCLQKSVDILSRLNGSDKDVMELEKCKLAIRKVQQSRIKLLQDRMDAMQAASGPSPAQPAQQQQQPAPQQTPPWSGY